MAHSLHGPCFQPVRGNILTGKYKNKVERKKKGNLFNERQRQPVTKTNKLMLEPHLKLGRLSARFDHRSMVPTYVGLPLLSSVGHDINT